MVPKGWVAPQIAYVASEEFSQETTESIEGYEERLSMWQEAYFELSRESEAYAKTMETRWRKALSDLNSLEKRHKRELRRARSPGFGPFAGIAYTTDGDFRGVVGIGFVWRW